MENILKKGKANIVEGKGIWDTLYDMCENVIWFISQCCVLL